MVEDLLGIKVRQSRRIRFVRIMLRKIHHVRSVPYRHRIISTYKDKSLWDLYACVPLNERTVGNVGNALNPASIVRPVRYVNCDVAMQSRSSTSLSLFGAAALAISKCTRTQ